MAKNNTPVQLTQQQVLENKYNSARTSLLVVLAFTLINIALIFSDSATYFLFSLFFPYILVVLGALYTGRISGYDVPAAYMWTDAAFYVAVAAAAICVLTFVLCWAFSKKNRVGWLIAALVLSVLDTAFGIWYYGISMDMLIDVIFHGWLIVSLASGVSAHYKLKALPPEEEVIDTTAEIVEDSAPVENSPILRSGYLDEKCRVLLEAEKDGLYITYRRVKKTNELVINNNVYDEYTALIEMPHTLCATFAGHKIEAGCDTASRSFIKIDGEIVAKKLRLV